MPDISQINLPGDINNPYNIADLAARGLIWQGTQAQYNALTTINPNTVYFITDAAGTVLATVAITGSYNDLSDKPTIDSSLDTTSNNAIANGPVASFAESISSTVSNKMDKANPTGTGSLSLNKLSGSTLGTNAIAVGTNCTASGESSYAEGNGTIAQRVSQHVFGEFNQADTGGSGTTSKGDYVEIVGNGANTNSRSNARTLDWNGNETLAGDLTVNGSNGVAQFITFSSQSPNTTVTYTIPSSIYVTGGVYLLALRHSYAAGGVYILKVRSSGSAKKIIVTSLITAPYMTVGEVAGVENQFTVTITNDVSGSMYLRLTRIA